MQYLSSQKAVVYDSKGFSLVEVLVAISLLLIALVGPMTYLTRTSQSTEVANQRVVATFLAQEGIELVQKLRDDIILSSSPFSSSQDPPSQDEGWQDFISNLNVAGCFGSIGCAVEMGGTHGDVQLHQCTDPGANRSECRLYLDTSSDRNSWYTYVGGTGSTQTPYTRRIILNTPSIDPLGELREIYVSSVVTWRTGSFLRTNRVESTTTLFNIFYDQ